MDIEPIPADVFLILVTKLDKSRLLLNLDNVKYIEATPDTVIRFMNGDSLMIKEDLEEVHSQAIKALKKLTNQPQASQHEE